ncbi:MAG: GNAT family N-acetyltransferase [Gemmatimonadaceae bacterium]
MALRRAGAANRLLDAEGCCPPFADPMRVEYRPATPTDVDDIVVLLSEYMLETYHSIWHGTAERLKRDGLGLHCNMTVATRDGTCIGFAAWRLTYDLHHCVSGLEVIDMFVRPAFRGRGVGACLLAQVAAYGVNLGATFMTGGAVDTGSARRLSGRATMRHGGQTYLSGRAFRALAAQAGASPRELLERLPPPEWNLQP